MLVIHVPVLEIAPGKERVVSVKVEPLNFLELSIFARFKKKKIKIKRLCSVLLGCGRSAWSHPQLAGSALQENEAPKSSRLLGAQNLLASGRIDAAVPYLPEFNSPSRGKKVNIQWLLYIICSTKY